MTSARKLERGKKKKEKNANQLYRSQTCSCDYL